MKKVFAFALALLLLAGALVGTGCNGDGLRGWLSSFSLRFAKQNDGTYAVVGHTSGLPLKVVIPKKHRGRAVTRIADGAFENAGTLVSVTIPDGVTEIGDGAFAHCPQLTVLTLPSSLQKIGDEAFRFCTRLSEVSFGENLTEIGENAFCFCETLSAVTIPANVTKIGDGAFAGCSHLVLMIASDNENYTVTDGCLIEKATKSVLTAPAVELIPTDGSVTRIGAYTFYSFGSLTALNLPECITEIGDCAFYGCLSLTAVNMPGVQIIGDEAFSRCEALKTVSVGGNLHSVGYAAFVGCRALETVNFDGTKADWYLAEKGNGWNDSTGAYTIFCTDGSMGK